MSRLDEIIADIERLRPGMGRVALTRVALDRNPENILQLFLFNDQPEGFDFWWKIFMELEDEDGD